MSSDQIGYRSVHYVCDLGERRNGLPEFSGLGGLKFEVQVRTVLQHAWAELAHDRGYKFSVKLPKSLERQLYLYAGMLELADRGFDELSNKIDQYVEDVDKKSDSGDLNLEVDSISLQAFVKAWAEREGVNLREFPANFMGELIDEMNKFGIYTLDGLNKIIPPAYGKVLRDGKGESNVLGLVRDWMVIHDYKRFYEDVDFNWCYEARDLEVLRNFLSDEQINEFVGMFEVYDFVDEDEDEDEDEIEGGS